MSPDPSLPTKGDQAWSVASLRSLAADAVGYSRLMDEDEAGTPTQRP